MSLADKFIKEEEKYLKDNRLQVGSLVTMYRKGLYLITDIKVDKRWATEDKVHYVSKNARKEAFKDPAQNYMTHWISYLQIANDKGLPSSKVRVYNPLADGKPWPAEPQVLRAEYEKHLKAIANIEKLFKDYFPGEDLEG